MAHPIYDARVTTIAGQPADLSEHRGKVLLIVNTASKCGHTHQYAALEELHRTYGPRGFAVLGFPCNQFLQEPGTEREIASFCQTHFGVTFPMYGKVRVNGFGAHPLYRHLERSARGVLGTKSIKWNFTKFLVDRRGDVVERFGPKTLPEELRPEIERLL